MRKTDNQSTYNRVKACLIRQGQKSENPGIGVCVLRGPRHPRTHRKTHCAIGCLLPDSKYSPNLEGHSYENNAPLRAVMTELGYTDHDFLNDLQKAHDWCGPSRGLAFVASLTASLGRLAAKYGLTP